MVHKIQLIARLSRRGRCKAQAESLREGIPPAAMAFKQWLPGRSNDRDPMLGGENGPFLIQEACYI